MASSLPSDGDWRFVVLTEYAYALGGAERVGIDTAVSLAGLGKTLLIAASGPVDPALVAAGVDVRTVYEDGFSFAKLPGFEKYTAAAWNGKVAEAVRGAILEGDPARTIVHAHSYKHQLTPSAIDAAHRAGARVVLTLHDYNAGCPTGGFYDYRQNRPCGERGGSLGCLLHPCLDASAMSKVKYFAKHVYGRRKGYLDGVAAFLPVSKFLADVIRPYLPQGAVMEILPNPITVPREVEANAHGRSGFLFVGRLVPEKAPVDFALAAKEAGVEATFLGEGPLAEAVREANPEARLPGQASRAEVWAAMRTTRALVFPSRWYEGQPLSVDEARAAGAPVIVSKACAGASVVKDGVTGLHIPAGDVEALGGALSALQNEPERAARMSQAAFSNYWADPSSPERYLERLLAVFDRVAVPSSR